MITPTDPEALKHALRRAYAAHDHLATRHALAVAAIEHSARQAILVTDPDDLAGFVAGLPEDAGHEVVLLAVYRDAFATVAADLQAQTQDCTMDQTPPTTAQRRAWAMASWTSEAAEAVALVRVGLAQFQRVTGRDFPAALGIAPITHEQAEQVMADRLAILSQYQDPGAPAALPDDLAALISVDTEQRVADVLNRAAEARAVGAVR